MNVGFFLRRMAKVAVAAFALVGGAAQAGLINYDLTSLTGADAYSGAAVYGTSSSVWNHLSRSDSASGLALVDDTGAATSATLSYTRLASGFLTPATTGAFGDLYMSHVYTGTAVVSGLLSSTFYDLVVYSNWSGAPTFQAGGQTEFVGGIVESAPIPTEGGNYVHFLLETDSSGNLSFTPLANPTDTITGLSEWSGFQLQQATTVPEPATAALMLGALGLLVAVRRRA